MSGRVLVIDDHTAARQRAVDANAGAPAGFRRDANGSLLVPEAYSRTRDVITKDEWRALDRAIRLVLGPRDIKFILACGHTGCPDPKIVKFRNPDGGFTLRCGHADRVVVPSI